MGRTDTTPKSSMDTQPSNLNTRQGADVRVTLSQAGSNLSAQEQASGGTYEQLAAVNSKNTQEDKQAEVAEKQEEQEIKELKDRDTEVRIHEQAHAAVGGQYAGAPQYEYETGPNGKRYAVGGEVSIDVSEEKDPEDTISKMQIVRAAALAPAEPSSQDYKVAALATQKEQVARAELAKQPTTDESNDISPAQIPAPNSLAINQYQAVQASSYSNDLGYSPKQFTA